MKKKTLYHVEFKAEHPLFGNVFKVKSPEFECMGDAIIWATDNFYKNLDGCLYQWFDFPTRDERNPEFRLTEEQYGEKYQKLIKDIQIEQTVGYREIFVLDTETPNPYNHKRYLKK